MPCVEHFDEARLSALRGGVAMPCPITSGHKHERCVADEILDVCGHVVFDFGDRSAVRIRITKLLSEAIRFNGYRHGSSFPYTRCIPILAVSLTQSKPQ